MQCYLKCKDFSQADLKIYMKMQAEKPKESWRVKLENLNYHASNLFQIYHNLQDVKWHRDIQTYH